MKVFDGVRVFSLFWVILGNTYYYAFSSIVINPQDFESYFNQFYFMIITGSFFAVETFLFMSGFFAAYSFLKNQHYSPIFIITAYI